MIFIQRYFTSKIFMTSNTGKNRVTDWRKNQVAVIIKMLWSQALIWVASLNKQWWKHSYKYYVLSARCIEIQCIGNDWIASQFMQDIFVNVDGKITHKHLKSATRILNLSPTSVINIDGIFGYIDVGDGWSLVTDIVFKSKIE